MPPRESEYWQIQCPHCLVITYYKLLNPAATVLKWPVLECRCGKFFTKRESELCNFTTCEVLKNPTDFQKKRSKLIELEKK